MPVNFPRRYRSEDDASAPRDYSFVDSVAEGARRRQAEPIHPPAKEPAEADGVKRTRKPAAYPLPRAEDGPAPAQSVAYPRTRSNAFAQAPSVTPVSPPPLAAVEASAPPVRPAAAEAQTDSPRARRAAPRQAYPAQPQAPSTEAPVSAEAPPAPAETVSSAPADRSFVLQDGRYAPPPAQEIPDWLTAARQNQTAPQRPEPPRVTHAPPSAAPTLDPLGRPVAVEPRSRADAYAAAGYPPDLIARQRSQEAQAVMAQGYGHKRHGAQYTAARREEARIEVPPRAQTAAGPSSYPPPREAWAREQQAASMAAAPRVRYAPQAAPPPETARTNPYYALTPEAQSPYQVVDEEAPKKRRREPENGDEAATEETDGRKRGFPFLGLAVFLAALLAVGLYVMQTSFTARTDAVLAARVAAQQKLLDAHPYSYRELIEREAEANNLQPAFVAAIVLNESSFNPGAESSVGARGLMQMMPDTAEWVHGKIDADTDYSFDLMYDPEKNVTYACWYLAYLSDRFYGDPVLVSAAFHAGQTTVQNWLNDSRYSADSQSINLADMAEGPTKNYATRVLNAYAIYLRMYYEGGAQALETAETAAST